MNEEFIVLDVESTGLDVRNDRIIEIGCILLCNNQIKDMYHEYIDTDYLISKEAFKVHGIDKKMIEKHHSFNKTANSFLAFLGNRTLVAHNAKFDITIINNELQRNGFKKLENNFIDTLYLARKKFPGQRANLDSLCERLNLNIKRDLHSAIEDAKILAQVFSRLQNMKLNISLSFNMKQYDWSNRKPRYEIFTNRNSI